MRIEHGDCVEVMKRLIAEGVLLDGCISDPPYHLHSIVQRFGGDNAASAISNGETGLYRRISGGFMGKKWDGGDIAFTPALWRLVYQLLKPGAYVIAFSHTTRVHRLACAIEDAGFEIRDQLDWVYGQGAPKSHNMTGEFEGYGTGLKPCKEPAVLARKPLIGTVLENMTAHGVGALNIAGSRIDLSPEDQRDANRTFTRAQRGLEDGWGWNGNQAEEGVSPLTEEGRWPGNLLWDGSDEVARHFPDIAGAAGSVTGEEPSKSTETIFGSFSHRRPQKPKDKRGNAGRFFKQISRGAQDDWEARMFYCAKAAHDERVYRCSACDHRWSGRFADHCDNCGRRLRATATPDGEEIPPTEAQVENHPTVKPVDLMAYYINMVVLPGGTLLDPFAGTGSTGIAALREGRKAILIEMEAESIADIKFRLGRLAGEDTALFRASGG